MVLWSEDNAEMYLYVQAAYWLARGLCQPATQSSLTPHLDVVRSQMDITFDQISKLDSMLLQIKKSGDKIAEENGKVVTQTLSVQGVSQDYVNTPHLLVVLQMMDGDTHVDGEGSIANAEA